MERLQLYRSEHPEGAVETSVVVPVDPAGGLELDVCQRPERPGVEDRGADSLGLVQAGHALLEGVIERVADGPDRRGSALEVEVLGVSDRGVLDPASLCATKVPGGMSRDIGIFL